MGALLSSGGIRVADESTNPISNVYPESVRSRAFTGYHPFSSEEVKT
jgi:hypothetical protein